MSKISVGILLISTWKYNQFIDSTISEIRQYLFPNSDVKIYLHTDSTLHHDADKIIPIQHKPWPLIVLNRYHFFCDHINEYETDYIAYLDIDSKIIDVVDEKILHDFFVVEHSGWKDSRGTPDTNPQSTAYIKEDEALTYVCSGFLGGKKESFFKAARTMKENIQKDLNNNVVALWHDESHLNRYIIDHKNEITILPHTYMYITGCKNNDLKKSKILAIYKQFNKFEKDRDPHA